MAFKPTPGRRRTRHLDLDAATKSRRGGIYTAVSPKHLSATLMAIGFWLLETLVVVVGAPLDWGGVAGVAALILVANLLVGWYMSLDARDVVLDRRRLLLVQSLTLLALSLTKIIARLDFPDEHLIPLAVFSVALAIGVGRPLAVLWTIIVAGAIGLISGLEPRAHPRLVPILPGFDLSLAITLGAGSLVAIFAADKVARRGQVIRAGVLAGVAYCVVILAMTTYLKGGQELLSELRHDPTAASELLRTLVLAFLNGVFTGYFLVEAGLSFVETSFDVVTDLRLQELADLNQPILKKLAREAPGTFHHSQMVGTLAESAAEAIGANALLCRVGAHFHDIGKMAKPEYFIENVRGRTKHEGLTPTMSTLIIIGHVKDGIEIAEELGLPSKIIDFIPEHHGTIAVEFFYHQARKQQQECGGPPVSLDDFRYPGPRPRTRETAILMVADTVEAMSRVLEEPNAQRVEALVREVVTRRLEQGQFDDSAITLKELREVERAMVRVLLGAHHGRIKYPKPDREALGALRGVDPTDTGSKMRLARDMAEGPGVPSAAAMAPPEQDAIDASSADEEDDDPAEDGRADASGAASDPALDGPSSPDATTASFPAVTSAASAPARRRKGPLDPEEGERAEAEAG